MSTQETGGGLSKWQIAALIGAPIAAACVLGALYYWRSSQSSEQKDPEKGEEVDTTTSTSGVPKNEAPESEENMVCVRKIISQKNPCFSSPPLKWTLSWATYCFTPPSLNPFNSQRRWTCNFSQRYPFFIQQKGNENIKTYQVEVVILIKQNCWNKFTSYSLSNLQGNYSS